MRCDSCDRALSRLQYSKGSLASFVRSYNAGIPDTRSIPSRKYGIFVGYGVTNFKATSNTRTSFDEKSPAFSVGMFGDFPQQRYRWLTISGELNWLRSSPSLYSGGTGYDTEFFALDMNAFNAALNFKFTTRLGPISPYGKAGGSFSYVLVSSPTGLITTEKTLFVVDIYKERIPNASAGVFGFQAATGIDIPLGGTRNIYLEVKYSRMSNGNYLPITMNYSTVGLVAGFNF